MALYAIIRIIPLSYTDLSWPLTMNLNIFILSFCSGWNYHGWLREWSSPLGRRHLGIYRDTYHRQGRSTTVSSLKSLKFYPAFTYFLYHVQLLLLIVRYVFESKIGTGVYIVWNVKWSLIIFCSFWLCCTSCSLSALSLTLTEVMFVSPHRTWYGRSASIISTQRPSPDTISWKRMATISREHFHSWVIIAKILYVMRCFWIAFWCLLNLMSC